MKTSLIHLYTVALLIKAAFSLQCLLPCNYTVNLTSDHYTPEECASETKEARVCSAELSLNYAHEQAYVQRRFLQQFPIDFNETIQTLTVLKASINLQFERVYYNFTHYCSTTADCTKVFLLNTFSKYRTLPSQRLVDELRQLLKLDKQQIVPSSPTQCFTGVDISTECYQDRCSAGQLSYTDTVIRVGCGEYFLDHLGPVLVLVGNMDEWTQFSFQFQCHWSLCNTGSLVRAIKGVIRRSFNSTMETMAMSRSTSTEEMLTTPTYNYEKDETTSINHINSTGCNHQRSFSSLKIVCFVLMFSVT